MAQTSPAEMVGWNDVFYCWGFSWAACTCWCELPCHWFVGTEQITAEKGEKPPVHRGDTDSSITCCV